MKALATATLGTLLGLALFLAWLEAGEIRRAARAAWERGSG